MKSLIRVFLPFFFFTILSASGVLAKDNFVKATLYMLDGKKMECYINTPFSHYPKRFVIKKSLNDSKQTLKPKEIDYMVLTKENKKHLFKFSKFHTIFKKGTKITDDRILLLALVTCPNYTTFLNANEYSFNKKGDVILERTGYEFRYYFLQKKENEYPMDLSFFLTYQKSKVPQKRKDQLLELVKGDKSFTDFVKSNNVITVDILDAYFDSICE